MLDRIKLALLAMFAAVATTSAVMAQESGGGLIDTIMGALGIEGGAAGGIGLIVLAARFGAKMIPDDATGVMGLVRQLLKIVGAYTENRKTSNDPVT